MPTIASTATRQKAARHPRVRQQDMVIAQNSPTPCLIAVCRESIDDGNEWSIYVLSEDEYGTIEVIVEQIAFEWGDLGHSEAPSTRFTLTPGSAARIWRVDADDAELSMSVTLRIEASRRHYRVLFELGKLYRYRDPTVVKALALPGWMRSASECRLL